MLHSSPVKVITEEKRGGGGTEGQASGMYVCFTFTVYILCVCSCVCACVQQHIYNLLLCVLTLYGDRACLWMVLVCMCVLACSGEEE